MLGHWYYFTSCSPHICMLGIRFHSDVQFALSSKDRLHSRGRRQNHRRTWVSNLPDKTWTLSPNSFGISKNQMAGWCHDVFLLWEISKSVQVEMGMCAECVESIALFHCVQCADLYCRDCFQAGNPTWLTFRHASGWFWAAGVARARRSKKPHPHHSAILQLTDASASRSNSGHGNRSRPNLGQGAGGCGDRALCRWFVCRFFIHNVTMVVVSMEMITRK